MGQRPLHAAVRQLGSVDRGRGPPYGQPCENDGGGLGGGHQ